MLETGQMQTLFTKYGACRNIALECMEVCLCTCLHACMAHLSEPGVSAWCMAAGTWCAIWRQAKRPETTLCPVATGPNITQSTISGVYTASHCWHPTTHTRMVGGGGHHSMDTAMQQHQPMRSWHRKMGAHRGFLATCLVLIAALAAMPTAQGGCPGQLVVLHGRSGRIWGGRLGGLRQQPEALYCLVQSVQSTVQLFCALWRAPIYPHDFAPIVKHQQLQMFIEDVKS